MVEKTLFVQVLVSYFKYNIFSFSEHFEIEKFFYKIKIFK